MVAEPFPPRTGPPVTAGERETLRAFLDYQRATLAMKCHGLSDDDLRRQSSQPSTLSLLGLVRHMAEVERTWFRRVIDAEDVGFVWSDQGDYQVAYDARTSTRSEAFARLAGRGRAVPPDRVGRAVAGRHRALRAAGMRTSRSGW